MKLQGEHRFGAARERVWQALMDPEVLAGTLPGFQKLERTGEHEFAGMLAIGVGPVQGRFEGKVQLADLVEPESYTLQMEGRGAPGFLKGQGSIRLQDAAGGTLLIYDVDVDIGGRIAGLGQRVLEMTGRMLTKQALASLDKALG